MDVSLGRSNSSIPTIDQCTTGLWYIEYFCLYFQLPTENPPLDMDVSLSCSLSRVSPAVVQILYRLCNVHSLFNLTSNPCTDCDDTVMNVQMMCNQSDLSAKGLGQQYYDGVSVGWGPDRGGVRSRSVCASASPLDNFVRLHFCKCYDVHCSLISCQFGDSLVIKQGLVRVAQWSCQQ